MFYMTELDHAKMTVASDMLVGWVNERGGARERVRGATHHLSPSLIPTHNQFFPPRLVSTLY